MQTRSVEFGECVGEQQLLRRGAFGLLIFFALQGATDWPATLGIRGTTVTTVITAAPRGGFR
jgi:hypothetical protein